MIPVLRDIPWYEKALKLPAVVAVGAIEISAGGGIMYSSMNNFKENISKSQDAKTSKVDEAKMKDDIKELDGKLDKIEKVKYGDQYTKVNGKKVLKSNIEYVTEEGYKYVTDSGGRISKVEGSLEPGKAKRNAYAQRNVGRNNGRLDTDDGGHLIASIFKGSGDIDNLVPMDATLNRGDWKAMENTWAKALDRGKTVEVRIEPIYSGNSMRPISFDIEYKIGNGDWEIQSFSNTVGGYYNGR